MTKLESERSYPVPGWDQVEIVKANLDVPMCSVCKDHKDQYWPKGFVAILITWAVISLGLPILVLIIGIPSEWTAIGLILRIFIIPQAILLPTVVLIRLVWKMRWKKHHPGHVSPFNIVDLKSDKILYFANDLYGELFLEANGDNVQLIE